MSKKQKKMLVRIIAAAVLLIVLNFIPATGIVRFILYLVPYLVIGYDILLKALKGIKNRQVFDENFLMAVATVGAIALALYDRSGDYTEAVAVMLFYQVGEWFQSYAVGRSRRNISDLMDIRPDYANIEQDSKLEQVDKNLSLKNSKGPKKTISPKKIKIGDGVRVLTMNLNGTVSSLPNAKGDLYVQMGILRSLVNIKDLELLNEPSVTGPGMDLAGKKNATGAGKIKMSKSFSVSPEVNLIGMTVDEAIPVLDKYLDDAYLAHLPQVRVVHGRGTGALKAGVHKHLRKLKYVKEFRLGDFGEGDTGVTIVTFK